MIRQETVLFSLINLDHGSLGIMAHYLSFYHEAI